MGGRATTRITPPSPGQPLTVADADEQQALATIQRSGLFDGGWSAARDPGLGAGGHEMLVHWHRYGWREVRWPNPYFDPVYHAAQAPDCVGNPLIHYVVAGEAGGRRPVTHFDAA